MTKKKIFAILLTLFLGFVPFLAKANPPGPLPDDPNAGIKFILSVAIVLCVTTLIESLVSLLAFKFNEIKKTRFIYSIIVANLISYPIFIFFLIRVFPFAFSHDYWALSLSDFFILFGLELGVVLIESLISWLVIKKFLSFSKILFIIFINNLVTCILGFIFFWIVGSPYVY